MHTTKFYWMLDHVDPAPDRPRRPMRERCVVVRNRHGYTITTRHYTDGDVALRHAECAAAIMHALTRMAIEDDYLTTRRWDAARPRWAPLANNLQSSIGASLSDLAARVGMHMRTSRKLCDCGSQWTHTVDIQIVNSSGATLPETLRLCDACYAEFVAMEACYG